MQNIYAHAIKAELEFAEEAAAHFANNPKHWSYSKGEPDIGDFLALRWGLGDDCVLVVKLDDAHEPTIYGQLISQAKLETPPW